MSFIRHNQGGHYVDIPGGSNYYLYGDCDDIGGWTYEEFAAVVFDALNEVDPWVVDAEYWIEIADGIEDELGVEMMDPDYRGGIAQPERAEIFCQFVDLRIDGIELTDDLQEAMRESFEAEDYVKTCDYCGEEFRPYVDLGLDTTVCNDDECGKREEADMYNVDVETIEGLEEAHAEGGREAHNEYWDEHIEPNIETDD